MRHPALTRFFAAFLAVVSVITLISGGICIKKAADDREKQNKSTLRLSDRTAEAKALLTELDAMPTSFAQKNAAYETAKERYDSEKLSYRKDLSIYTATEAALKQAQEKIDEGYASLRMGWIEHDNGEKALNDAEAQFRPGYEQYLDGKARLEEGRRQYEQAEALKESLPDLAILRTALNALKASKANIDASLDAIQNTLQNPPLDPETGEVDTEAQRAQLRRELLALSGQLAAVQTVLLEEYGPELLARELGPAAASLGEQAQSLADGDLSEEELVAAAERILASGKSLSGAFDEAIANAEQTLTLLESLPEMKAQLDQAEAALKEGEPALLQAKAAFDEGHKQLDKAKDMLIYAEAQLIAGKKELEEKQAEQLTTKEDLDGRKKALEEDAGKLEEMLGYVDEIEKRAPAIMDEYRQKITERVRDMLADVKIDESRILTEVALFADRVCVDEEIVRLRSHIKSTEDTLKTGGSVGRKLDFIAQEMNREANTILSKSNDLLTSNVAIDLKTDIEKVREQIQNIE